MYLYRFTFTNVQAAIAYANKHASLPTLHHVCLNITLAPQMIRINNNYNNTCRTNNTSCMCED